ncbi:hypothetical protein [Gimesia maris]|uniref:SHOCT domain-containing protein n=1 Tax=Gimesia maris TaxID=122 RepID=A0ABX5YLP3_9PLAN|nr:hypothetical protein [Gimesia maris]EDL57514.1 hypothetical protein PM8797T_32090 [Gimesia maris DSM 8797]QEG16596.1 hypothetical protein GmarT_24620 [Gimesia maris]QGQ30235.1 hypothetical protein F1729_17130 [Gimesia maris]HAW30298.1 hypothetical protein [Planctomycetaceae bacterium]
MIFIFLTLGNQADKQKLFKELLGDRLVEWILAVFIVSFLIWLIVWIVGRFRENEDRHVDARELLMQFAEMQREGDLTDDEFRSIKKRLVAPAKPGLEKDAVDANSDQAEINNQSDQQ